MQVQVSFQHTKTSAAMRERATTLAERLGRYFKGRITVGWHFAKEGNRCVAHCHVTGNHMDYFAEAQDADDNFYAAMDECLDRMERQIRKRKETVRDHLHRGSLKRAAALGAIALVAGMMGGKAWADGDAESYEQGGTPDTRCTATYYGEARRGHAWSAPQVMATQTKQDQSPLHVGYQRDDGNGMLAWQGSVSDTEIAV